MTEPEHWRLIKISDGLRGFCIWRLHIYFLFLISLFISTIFYLFFFLTLISCLFIPLLFFSLSFSLCSSSLFSSFLAWSYLFSVSVSRPVSTLITLHRRSGQPSVWLTWRCGDFVLCSRGGSSSWMNPSWCDLCLAWAIWMDFGFVLTDLQLACGLLFCYFYFFLFSDLWSPVEPSMTQDAWLCFSQHLF